MSKRQVKQLDALHVVLGLAVQCPFTARYRGLENRTSNNQWIGIMGETRLMLRIAFKITE